MTNLETKLHEFREAFRKAVLNREVPMKVIECDDNSSYEADFYVSYNGNNPEVTNMFSECLHFVVAPTFICYLNPLIQGAFEREDYPVLNQIIKDSINSQDGEKLRRIKELEKELKELKEAV